MSIEGFNLLRKRIRRRFGPYQLIIDDINLIDVNVAQRQIEIIGELFAKEPDQLDKAIILMPPGMHLVRT